MVKERLRRVGWAAYARALRAGGLQIPEPSISSGSGGGVGGTGRPEPGVRGSGMGIGIHQVSSTSA